MIGFLVNTAGYLACLALGLGYPAYNSIVAIESRTTVDDTQWLTYWLVFSVMTLVEATFWPVLKWIPLYTVLKAVGLAWLVLPQFKGAAYIYEQGILPVYKLIMKQLDQLADKHPQLKKYIGQPSTVDKLQDLAGDIAGKVHAQ